MRFTNLCACVVLGVAIAGCGDNGTTTAPSGGGGAAATGTLSKADVDKLIADATAYIKDNKWDLADKGITQLEGLKSKFPDYATKIDDLRKSYDSAKAMAGKTPAMSMPKMP